MNNQPKHPHCTQTERLAKMETLLETVVETFTKIGNTLELVARTDEKLEHTHKMVAQYEVRLLSLEKNFHKQSWMPKVLATAVSAIVAYLFYKSTGVVIGL